MSAPKPILFLMAMISSVLVMAQQSPVFRVELQGGINYVQLRDYPSTQMAITGVGFGTGFAASISIDRLDVAFNPLYVSAELANSSSVSLSGTYQSLTADLSIAYRIIDGDRFTLGLGIYGAGGERKFQYTDKINANPVLFDKMVAGAHFAATVLSENRHWGGAAFARLAVIDRQWQCEVRIWRQLGNSVRAGAQYNWMWMENKGFTAATVVSHQLNLFFQYQF